MGKFNPSDLEDSYSVIAENLKMCHFDFGEHWRKLEGMVEDGEMWRINEKFIEIHVAKTFYFTHDPTDATISSSYGKEVNYFKNLDKQIIYDNKTKMWKLQ